MKLQHKKILTSLLILAGLTAVVAFVYWLYGGVPPQVGGV